MPNENRHLDEIDTYHGLPALYVQLIAFVFLVIMFLVDKVFRLVIPPLDDYWYIGLASIAFFGADLAQKLWKNKGA